MAKILIIENCGECPYSYEGPPTYAAPSSMSFCSKCDDKMICWWQIEPKEKIPEWCPLPDAESEG